MSSRQIKGLAGEEEAARYLEARGYVVLDRRYRFERAEVDLVCFEPRRDGKPGGEIVFVEVKARTTDTYGPPEASVDPSKQRRIVKAARAYLYERKLEGAFVRFDVVAIRLGEVDPSGSDADRHVTHYKHAFTA